MEVRILGPVELLAGGQRVDIGARRQRFVLAVLALEVNRLVPVEQIVELTWPGGAPRTAVHAVQVIVSGLRSALAAVPSGDRGLEIVTRGTGYLLRADRSDVDASRFLDRLGEARSAAGDGVRATILTEALALWSGPALSGVADADVRERLCRGLESARLSAYRELGEARLAIGEYAHLIPDLDRLVHEYPFDEELHRQLMMALYRAGRQADALAVFRRLRGVLDTELGIDPSQPLRDLESAILRQDSGLDAVASAPAVAVTPAQLPPALPTFVGRRATLDRLDAIMSMSTGAPIVVLSGTAGIGKTTTAVQWAHSVAARFPDGQLYANLRGFGPVEAAVEPAAALRSFLEAFAIAPERIPATVEARAAMFRSLVAGRRVLVVLDNARDAPQVRPLLPAGPGCLTLVTSRSHLTPLVATEGAQPLPLDLLSAAEAGELLGNRVGHDRIAAEPRVASEIVARCARLPLALAVVAARAATQPRFPLADVAAELRDAAGGLDALQAGDTFTDVRAVLSWSYHALLPEAAALFRLLGTHPGPDISSAAAASLAALPMSRLRPLLVELTDGHLITEHRPGRYAFHDLLRAFAGELAEQIDPLDARRTALQRVLEHYVHTGFAAAMLLNPYRDPLELPPPMDGAVPENPADQQRAYAWFTAEHDVLMAAIDATAAAGLDLVTWQLTWTLATFLNRQGRWREWAVTWQLALTAAERLGDPDLLARACRSLGWVHIQLGETEAARAQLERALTIYERSGDLVGRADTHLDLGRLVGEDYKNAWRHARQALDLYRAAGHRNGQAVALNNLGWTHTLLGDYHEGLDACRESLAIHVEIGNLDGAAGAWDSLGYAHHHLGQYAEAVGCFEHAVEIYREIGDRYEEAVSLTHLGDAHADHDRGRARAAWTQALSIMDDIGHSDAGSLRSKLDHPS